MAQDATGRVSYYLLVKTTELSDLSALRKWTNLKVAFEKEEIWITNFEQVQIESVTVKSIPYKKVYYSKEGKLFLQNSRLPEGREPNFLWSPIERAFPIELGAFNHNYFGVNEKLEIKLVKDEEPKKEAALLIDLATIYNYVDSAPEIRLKGLEWVVINNKKALLFGTPFLPINGNAFWMNQTNIIPVGYNFELFILNAQIQNNLNPAKECWVVWNTEGTYFKIEKELVMPLTIGAVRKTRKRIEEELRNGE